MPALDLDYMNTNHSCTVWNIDFIINYFATRALLCITAIFREIL